MENQIIKESGVEAPEWLTKDFIERALRKFFKNDEIKVDRIIGSNCGGIRENYVSIMFRIAAYYHHQTSPCDIKAKSLIVKTATPQMVLEKSYGVHKKEMTFYEECVPKFEEILAKIGEDGKTFPDVIFVDRELKVIVLEDLKERNFSISNRIKGLDENQIKMSFGALSRMHAASLVLYEKDQKAFVGFEFGLFSRKLMFAGIDLKIFIENFSIEVESWTEWDKSSYFASKLKNILDLFAEKCFKPSDFNESNFNVLTHADMWTNNILFSYDNGTPSSSVLIDFQFSFYGSASLDLIYLLFTSSADHLMNIGKMEEMVQFYFYELKSLLKKLNFDMKKLPSLKNFQVEFFRNLFFGVVAGFVVFPILINQADDVTFEKLKSSDENGKTAKQKIYKNPRSKKIAMQLLPAFDRRGLHDEI